jgi:RimJ/RimL family protein N-acetyltransferase
MPPAPTVRVTFRRWTENDLPLARALWGDARVTALIGGPFDDAAVRRRLDAERATEAAHGMQYWPIFDAAGGAHLGCCGLRPYDLAARVLELGVHLRPEAGGRGLASEAARAAIAYGFGALGASALFAGHHPDNAASRRMLEKLGFAWVRDELYPPTGRMHPSYLLQNP